jgi:hypothetical protein
MALFREIVTATWAAERATVETATRHLSNHASDLRVRLERLEEAFIFDRSIDRQTYERQRDKIQGLLAEADVRLQQSSVIDVDVEGVLSFAERLLCNVSEIWRSAADSHQRAFQLALFPDGLPFDGENFGTAPTCLAFNNLPEAESGDERLASPRGSGARGNAARPGAARRLIAAA